MFRMITKQSLQNVFWLSQLTRRRKSTWHPGCTYVHLYGSEMQIRPLPLPFLLYSLFLVDFLGGIPASNLRKKKASNTNQGKYTIDRSKSSFF